jgi:CRISPR/Cas system-associated exonuclease Cas4 (RecB family)
MSSKIINGWMKSMYRPKDCEYSVTDITMPSAQLWAKAHSNFEENTEKTVGFKSFLGSALHKAIEETDEDGVIKELSWVRTLKDGTRIGGTTDELRWRYSINKWRLGDVKLKGDYPTKKFLGIGTKANPNPKPEQEKEQLQMSIYRWLFEGMFDIEDKGVIYLFTPGHSSWAAYDEMQEVWIDLLPISTVDTYIKGKIAVTKQKEQPEMDCPKWLCSYCAFTEACTHYTVPEEECTKEFKNED